MKLSLPWLRNKRTKQSEIDCNMVMDALNVAGTSRNSITGEYANRWVEIVIRHCSTDLVSSPLNTTILGARAMGRSAVMSYLVHSVNAQFCQDRHAAIHIALESMVAMATVYAYTSVEEVFKAIVSAPIELLSVHTVVGADRSLGQIQAHLKQHLDVPVSKLSFLAVRETFSEALDRLGIRTLSYYIDDVSALSPSLIPVLLQMLLDTFPRGGRVSFRLGGSKQLIKLQGQVRTSASGMQFGHDILIGLDIEQMLTSDDCSPSSVDPRQVFLLQGIKEVNPDLHAMLIETEHPRWELVFDPPDVWYELFKVCDYDIEGIGASLEGLLAGAGIPDERITRPTIVDVADRVKNTGKSVRPEKG